MINTTHSCPFLLRLLTKYHNGELVPRRAFLPKANDWDESQKQALLKSVIRNWPIGTIVWWERAVEGKDMVLDGQARLDVLLQALWPSESAAPFYCYNLLSGTLSLVQEQDPDPSVYPLRCAFSSRTHLKMVRAAEKRSDAKVLLERMDGLANNIMQYAVNVTTLFGSRDYLFGEAEAAEIYANLHNGR